MQTHKESTGVFILNKAILLQNKSLIHTSLSLRKATNKTWKISYGSLGWNKSLSITRRKTFTKFTLFPKALWRIQNTFQISDCCYLIPPVWYAFSLWYGIISWHIKEISLAFYSWDFILLLKQFPQGHQYLIRTHKHHISEAERIVEIIYYIFYRYSNRGPVC